MADDRRDESPREGFDDDEFGALARVRRALEAVERQQDGVLHERRLLRERLDGLLSALREDAVVLAFDRDGELIEASGCVHEHLGVTADELVADLEDFADEETIEALEEANRTVLEGEPSAACVSDGFLKAGDEEMATTFVHVPRTDAEGEIIGIEAIGIIAPAPELDEEEEAEADPFEPLLEQLARRLLADPSKAGIERAARAFGDFLGADRVVVNQYHEADRAFSVKASWLRPGTDPLPAEERGISISELPWAYSALGAGESIIIAADADLPREARREKELYAGDDASSSLMVPILRHDALAGFVSVQSTAAGHGWQHADAARARLFGTVLSAALVQADAEKALTQAREEAALASAARADAETALADARDEVERLDNTRRTAESEIEALEERETSLQQQLDSAREETEELRRELAAARREHGEATSKLRTLEDETERAQRRSEDAAAEALRVRDEVEGLRRRLAESERELAELRAEAGAAAARATPGDTDRDDEEDAPAAGWSFGDSAPAAAHEVSEEDDAATPDEAEDDDEPDRGWQPAGRGEPVEERGFDPDATVDVTSARGRRFGFDPDATIEMDPSHADAFAGRDADAEAEDVVDNAAADDTETSAADRENAGDDFTAAFEPTQSSGDSEDSEPDAPTRWRDDKASWEDSTDEVALPHFLDDSKADHTDFAASRGNDVDTTEPGIETIERDSEQVDADDVDAVQADSFDLDSGELEVVEPVDSSWDEQAADDDAAGEPEGEGLPELPGVDVERGLAEVGGNVELYRNLLGKFRNDYFGAAEKIDSAIEKGNIEVAHLLLHAVKGVAGVLGAERVRESADELETRLIGGDASATRAAVDGFSTALHEVLDSIDMLEGKTFALLPETAPAEAESADAGESDEDGGIGELQSEESDVSSQHADPTVLRSYLSGLRPHIMARKPRQCMLVMQEVKSRNWAGDYNQRLAELSDLIEEGDFETASDSYRELMERLEQA